MITVKIHDKRCINKYRIEFFYTENVTDDVINFVRKNDKAYQILLYDKLCSREEFLSQFDKVIEKR